MKLMCQNCLLNVGAYILRIGGKYGIGIRFFFRAGQIMK